MKLLNYKLLLFFLLTAFFIEKAYAADHNCQLEMHVVQAFKNGDSEINNFAEKQNSQGFEGFSDLETQLRAMNFKNYHIIDSLKRKFSPRGSDSFSFYVKNFSDSCTGSFSGKHSLVIDMQGLIGNKVDLIINWLGPNKEQILSTRLKIPNREQVIVASEGGGVGEEVIVVGLRFDCW